MVFNREGFAKKTERKKTNDATLPQQKFSPIIHFGLEAAKAPESMS